MKKMYEIYVDFINGIMEADKPIQLVHNDNDSTVLKFNIQEDVAGSRKVIKFKLSDGTCLVDELTNNEYELSAGFLSQKGNIKYELCIYDFDENSQVEKLTNFAIGTLFIREELVDENEAIELDDRLPIFTNLIQEVREIEEKARIIEIDGGTSNTDFNNNGGGA